MNSKLIDYCGIVFFEKASQLGFKKSRNKYIRIINDVYQHYTIRKLPSKRITIDFGVLPMCMPYDNYEMARYTLTDFLPLYECFKYYEDEESIRKCVEKLYVFSCKFMFPFFEKATTSTSAFAEILMLDKNVEQVRLANLSNNNITDYARQFELRTIPSLEKYYFALKTKNFEFIKYYLSLSTENYRYLITRHPDKKHEYLNKILENNAIIQRINDNSFDMSQELISNENYNFQQFNKYSVAGQGDG